MSEMELAEIESLLHDEYQYHDMSKASFLNWLREKFTENIESGICFMPVKLRYCTSCKPGNPTLLFNHGFFPKETDGFNRQKGFMCLAPDLLFDQAYELVTGHKLTPRWFTK